MPWVTLESPSAPSGLFDQSVLDFSHTGSPEGASSHAFFAYCLSAFFIWPPYHDLPPF